MGKEIYTRDEGARKYDSTMLEVSDQVSFLILSIENLLFTRKKEVLGFPNMGINLEDMLFSLNANNSDIKSAVAIQIYGYCPLAALYKVEVDVKFFNGTNRDICVIDIFVDGRKSISAVL